MSIFRWLLLFTFSFSLLAVGQEGGEPQKDPHRPPCTSRQCRKIRSFLKTHYCGESPFGNGPDEGCDTRGTKKPDQGTQITADYKCSWDESVRASKCKQRGQPTIEDQNIVLREMRQIGLPRRAEQEVHFKILKSASGLSVMKGAYDHLSGLELTSCSVIVVAEASGAVHVLRKVPLRKSENVDAADFTTWSPVDIADVDGDGHSEIVLEGDAYEDHWLEVVSIQASQFKTIFSGLGYYL